MRCAARLHPEGVVSYTLDGRVSYAAIAAEANLAGSAFDKLCSGIADYRSDGRDSRNAAG